MKTKIRSFDLINSPNRMGFDNSNPLKSNIYADLGRTKIKTEFLFDQKSNPKIILDQEDQKQIKQISILMINCEWALIPLVGIETTIPMNCPMDLTLDHQEKMNLNLYLRTELYLKS